MAMAMPNDMVKHERKTNFSDSEISCLLDTETKQVARARRYPPQSPTRASRRHRNTTEHHLQQVLVHGEDSRVMEEG